MRKLIPTFAAVALAISVATSALAADKPVAAQAPQVTQAQFSPPPSGAAALLPLTNLGALFATSTTTLAWTTTKFVGYKWVNYHGYWKKVPQYKKVQHTDSSKSINGKIVVGCIMGSALGAITAAVRKGTAMGNPLRWRSQAEHEANVRSGYEKQFELTNDEAATSVAFCGLGSLALHWPQQAPAQPVVRASN